MIGKPVNYNTFRIQSCLPGADCFPFRKNEKKTKYQPRGGNPIVVPVKIDPYKASRHVKIKDSLTSWYSKSIKNTQTKPVKQSKFKKLFKKDEDTYRCKLSQWYFRKKAARALKLEHRKELKQLKNLEKWKKHDQDLIHKAQMDKLQAEREAEVAMQLWEIEKERARLASNALKTHYPYKVEKKTAQTDDTYQRYYNTDYDKKHEDTQKYYEKYYQKYDDVTPAYTAYQNDIYEEEPKKNKKEKPFKLKREKPVKFKKEKEPKIKKEKPIKFKKPKPIKIKKEKPPKVKKVKPPKVKKEKPPKIKRQKGKKRKDYDEYDEQFYYQPMKEKKRKREKRHKAAKYKEVTILERPRRSLDEKFVNCFYKSCCEIYCCLSVVIIIGLVIIFII